jgi:phage tail tape-measure protein
MKGTPICIAAAASVLFAACGTTPTERAASGGLAGAALGAAVGGHSPLTGALVGGAAGAALGAYTAPKNGPAVNRRQYYDERAGRYYFYDPASDRYYWENGEPRERR